MGSHFYGWRGALCVAAVGMAACHRQTPVARQPEAEATATPVPSRAAPVEGGKYPDFAVQPIQTTEGKALWYDVPEASLAARRAWAGEMTAASDKLPQSAYVRVTRLNPEKGNDPKPVVVRVTDKSVGRKDALIEVDRDAASALGMVKDGEARVRVEVLALKNVTTDKPVDKPGGGAGSKASEVLGKPAADAEAEKKAAREKSGEKNED